MRLRIAICDADGDYARRIAEYARNSEFRRELDVTVCTRAELLGEWRRSGRFHVYAVGIEWAESIGKVPPDDRSVVWIGERAGLYGPNGVPAVAKYMPAPALIRVWACRGQRRRQLPKGAPVVGVWSAAGGAGRTKLIAHLSEYRTRRGLGTFVAGIDSGALPHAAVDASFHDAAEWLFHIKTEGAAPGGGEGAAADTPLHAFAPDCSYREWSGISRTDGEKLLDGASSAVDGIVLADAGAGWSPWAEAVMDRAELLICLSSNDESGLAKTRRWLADWPEWEDGGAYRAKTMFVLNRCLPETYEEAAGERLPDAARLPYVPEWKQDPTWRDAIYQRTVERLAEEVSGRCRER